MSSCTTTTATKDTATTKMATPVVYFAESTLGEQFGEILESGDNGIHACFMERHTYPSGLPNSGSNMVFHGEHRDSKKLKKSLGGSSDESSTTSRIKKLYPFQIEAVSNIVYRPKTVNVSKTIQRNRLDDDGTITMRSHSDSGSTLLETDQDDIGMTVTNDLFTGSGKTLTSVLGAIVFARDRKQDIIDRYPLLAREQLPLGWNTRLYKSISRSSRSVRHNRTTMLSRESYSNVVVIMCAKHLVCQWKKACLEAMAILGSEYEVLVNPKGSLRSTDFLKIAIYDNATRIPMAGFCVVPVIIVDEFVTKNPSNILTRSFDEIPVHGRLILVSADAGSVRNTIFGANRKSLMRKIVGYDNNDYGFDVEETMRYGIPLMSTCVLPTRNRDDAKKFMVSQMSKIPFEEYIVRYTPTLSSRLFGVSSEMSALSGKQLFLERYGITMGDTRSIGDIERIVADRIASMEETNPRRNNLSELHKTIKEFSNDGGSCPVCLEAFDTISSASLLNPCWHIFCDDCVTRLMKTSGHKCPMCRTKIEGHTVAVNSLDITPENTEDAEEGSSKKGILDDGTLVENMRKVVDPSMGLDRACITILKCLETDVKKSASVDCYRVIMVVPDDNFFRRFSGNVEEEFGKGVIDMIRFQTVGDKRKRVTKGSLGKNVEDFGSESGPRVKILFTTEGVTDSLTGLDFPNVDCLFSVGFGNSVQRLGRLTRIPKILDDKYRGRTVRSISLVPSSTHL